MLLISAPFLLILRVIVLVCVSLLLAVPFYSPLLLKSSCMSINPSLPYQHGAWKLELKKLTTPPNLLSSSLHFTSFCCSLTLTYDSHSEIALLVPHVPLPCLSVCSLFLSHYQALQSVSSWLLPSPAYSVSLLSDFRSLISPILPYSPDLSHFTSTAPFLPPVAYSAPQVSLLLTRNILTIYAGPY